MSITAAPPTTPRPQIIGPDSGPEPPFPLRMSGLVVPGFGRGSKELGIPTANIPVDSAPWIADTPSGVYFGWAGVQLPAGHPSHPSTSPTSTSSTSPQPPAPHRLAGWVLHPMVMSIGYNPFYKNTVRSAEVHVLHAFGADFYGARLALSVLGFVRPEYDYVDRDSLVRDIEEDIAVARRSLERGAWRRAAEDGFLWGEGEGQGA